MPLTTNDLDRYISFDDVGARLVGVDDDRPYTVDLDGRGYRFPDRNQARDFVRSVIYRQS